MGLPAQKSTFISAHTNDLDLIASQIISKAGNKRVFALFGKMGSGKTTLTKALCKYLGVAEHVTSPTFTLLNEYQDEKGEPVYHFDFYRIKSESEAFDFGFETYLYSGNYCFIEWPEKVAGLLPDEMASLNIEVDDNKRKIILST